MCKEDITFI